MFAWKEYVFSILVWAIICGIFLQIMTDSKKKALIQIICGTVLVILLLNPLSSINIDELIRIPDLGQSSSAIYIADGNKMIAEARSEAMKASSETYIMESAKKLGADVTTTVTLDDNCIPIFVKIESKTEPSIQRELERILIEEMGIPKENQEWIWNQEKNGS